MYIILTSLTLSGQETTTSINETESIVEARRLYHATLAAAYAQSTLEYVLCMVITDTGSVIYKEEYTKPITYTVTYDSNGGSGTIPAVVVNKDDEIELSNGSGITPPSGKLFAGWATTSSATIPNVYSPYMPTADVTLYAVWVNA